MKQVNTRRKNKSWPKDARLVHVDRTPCSVECMQTHRDENTTKPILNKTTGKTYGKISTESTTSTELQGIPNREVDADAEPNMGLNVKMTSTDEHEH